MLYLFTHDPSSNQIIKGKDYQELLDCCFQHSAYFSFTFQQDMLFGDYPWPFYPKWCKEIRWSKNHKGAFGYIEFFRCFFPCSAEARAFLGTHVDDWFDWWRNDVLDNPENPYFYRADGSVFCFSITHEGDSYLAPHEDEDVSHIVCHNGWESLDPDWEFGIALA